MEMILAKLHAANEMLARAKVKKDRDHDDYWAFKAIHAAISQLLEAVVLQQDEIRKLKIAKPTNGK